MSEYDYSYRNSGSQAEEQARRQLEQTKEQSASMVANLTTVQEKNGKKFFLGMQVPEELAGTLQYITEIMPTIVGDFLRDGVYDHSSRIYNKLVSPDKLGGHKAGLAATAAMSGLLIGMQPISGVIHAVRERGRERASMREAMSAIADANKDAYRDNEVIKTAMEKINKTMVVGFKQAASGLPTVLLNGYYAVGSHKELARKKFGEFKDKHIELDGACSSEKERLVQNRQDVERRKLFFEQHSKDYSESEIKAAWEGVEKDRRDARRRRDHAETSRPEKPTETTLKTIALTGVGGLNIFLRQMVAKGAAENEKPTAYELIMQLQDKINEGNISQGSNITDQIIEIFQQNEKDRGRSGIGSALLEKLNPLAERIGEVIANKELDPLALVSLVGDGKVVNKRRFVKTEQLEELIDAQRKIFGSHEKTPLDEFLADFQSPKMIMQAIKDNLQTLDGKDKAVFASMLPDDVLLSAGVKKKDIQPLRAQGHDLVCDFVKSSTVELAQKPTEELKAKGLSERQIEAINALNELIVAGNDKNDKEIKSIVCRGDEVVGAVRNALLHDQLSGKGGNPWTHVIKKKIPVVVEKQPDMSAVERVAMGRDNLSPINGMV